MTYKVKLSKKNQGTLPVALLKTLGLSPNTENTLIIYEDINGNFVIQTLKHMVNSIQGSLGKKLSSKTKTKLAKMTPEEIIEAEKNAKYDHLKTKKKDKV